MIVAQWALCVYIDRADLSWGEEESWASRGVRFRRLVRGTEAALTQPQRRRVASRDACVRACVRSWDYSRVRCCGGRCRVRTCARARGAASWLASASARRGGLEGNERERGRRIGQAGAAGGLACCSTRIYRSGGGRWWGTFGCNHIMHRADLTVVCSLGDTVDPRLPAWQVWHRGENERSRNLFSYYYTENYIRIFFKTMEP